MRRHLSAIVVLTVLGAACAATEETATTPAPTAAATSTTAEPTTTTAAATTTTSPTTTTTTTTTLPPRGRFASGVQAMLGVGPADWESSFIDPGGVIYHDGLFHSFYNGIETWPAHVRVGYATSSDGRSWDKQSEDWLFTGEGLDWTGTSLFVHDVIILDDGTWAAYFSTASSSTNFASGVIGMATAPAATGPWTVRSDPVVEHGPDGAWDSDGVVDPSVVRVGDELWMYYDGNIAGSRAIGLATSTDGVEWTKYDDPATEAVGDPLLTAGSDGEWDENGVYDPQVVITDEGFVMSYFARSPGTSAPVYEAGLAYSNDGLVWEKDPDGPHLSSQRWGFGGIFLSALVHHEDTYFLYFDAQRSSGGTTALYVSHEGPLRP